VYKRDPDNKHRTLLLGQYSEPEVEYLAKNRWAFTEKVDGTNIRIMWDGHNITYGGKTDNAQIPQHLMNRLIQLFGECGGPFQEMFGDAHMCLYGEGFGAKIQKGGGNYLPDGQDFVLFDVKVGDWWLQRKDVADIGFRLGLSVVPIIGYGTLHEMVERAKSGFNSIWGDFLAEGIVARPTTELFSRNGKRIITKIKHKDFT
jgi:hypothetical protein